MTGSEVALALSGVYRLGERDCYDPALRRVFLSEQTAYGEGLRSRLAAAHECVHAMQHVHWPWLFRVRIYRLWFMPDWFQPVTWFLELHASASAIKWLGLRGSKLMVACWITAGWFWSYIRLKRA